MPTAIFSPDALILIAGGLYILGYLIINQVWLRISMLFGSLIYIAYYWTVADTPLWGAIYTSAAMIVANMVGIAGLFARNAKAMIPTAHRDLYDDFSALLPGDFRAVVNRATRHRLAHDLLATAQGQPTTSLYFVIEGQVHVSKGADDFVMPPRLFVGEVAYLLGGASAATTVIPAGAEVLEWKLPDLLNDSRRNVRLKLALDAVLSRDMARKVALAIAPAAYQAGLNS